MIIQEMTYMDPREAHAFVASLNDDSLAELRQQIELLKEDITKKLIMVKNEYKKRAKKR